MKLSQLVIHKIIPALLLASALTGRAATNYFVSPSFRGAAGSESAYWEIFTSAYGGANSPDGIAFGGLSLANATITQDADPGAFLTGTGNIYDYAAPTGFTLNEIAAFNIGQVFFQTRTAGSPLDYNSVTLTYDLGSGPTTLAGNHTLLADAEGGDSSLWAWDLSSSAGVSSFSINFNASDASMSYDSAMLDVAAVPEPSVIALLLLGGLGLVIARRFRGQPSR